jgi:glyoxylase-like metal-dependent hydrolase (beta-lactamase superfamily II)
MMTIKVLKLTLGPLQTNCYIVGDSDTNQAVVIDPSDRAPLLLETARGEGWTIREILATHGHFDHILASGPLKALTGAPFRLHQRDLPLARAMPQRVRDWLQFEVPPAAEPDSFVDEGDTITVGGIILDTLFTPGHSPGHVSYVLRGQNMVFSGDCLFYGSIGRTDLPGGHHQALMRSIIDKLLPLGDECVVAPGHMRNTTIGYERQFNPHLIEYLGDQRSG